MFNLAADHQSLKILFLTHCYSNLVCFSLLENQLRGAPFYQILSFATKPVVNYATKPERVLQR
jgi:hypothetical protein